MQNCFGTDMCRPRSERLKACILKAYEEHRSDGNIDFHNFPRHFISTADIRYRKSYFIYSISLEYDFHIY